jgi:hypothetical protein
MTLKINYELLISFLEKRMMYGIPTKIDILYSLNKTQTRSVIPDGWEWK